MHPFEDPTLAPAIAAETATSLTKVVEVLEAHRHAIDRLAADHVTILMPPLFLGRPGDPVIDRLDQLSDDDFVRFLERDDISVDWMSSVLGLPEATIERSRLPAGTASDEKRWTY